MIHLLKYAKLEMILQVAWKSQFQSHREDPLSKWGKSLLLHKANTWSGREGGLIKKTNCVGEKHAPTIQHVETWDAKTTFNYNAEWCNYVRNIIKMHALSNKDKRIRLHLMVYLMQKHAWNSPVLFLQTDAGNVQEPCILEKTSVSRLMEKDRRERGRDEEYELASLLKTPS